MSSSIVQSPTLHFAELERQARLAFEHLRAGKAVDLAELSRGLGSVLEYALGDAFAALEATREIWVDGVVFDDAVVEDDGLRFSARTWCADHRSQWQVHSEILYEPLAQGGRQCRVTVRVGDPAVGDLREHQGRSGHRRARPEDWRHTFELTPDVRRARRSDSQ